MCWERRREKSKAPHTHSCVYCVRDDYSPLTNWCRSTILSLQFLAIWNIHSRISSDKFEHFSIFAVFTLHSAMLNHPLWYYHRIIAEGENFIPKKWTSSLDIFYYCNEFVRIFANSTSFSRKKKRLSLLQISTHSWVRGEKPYIY